MLTWFLKSFFKLLKLFFTVFPITALIFGLLLVFNIADLAGLSLPLGVVDSVETGSGFQLGSILSKNSANLGTIFSALKLWWVQTLAPYKGTFIHTLLWILTLIMFVPVMSFFLCWSVLSSFGIILFFAIVADAVLYVLRAIFGQSFLAQIRGRVHRLFPGTGVKYEEREYAKSLKKRNRELREEEREKRQRRWDAYYEDEEPEDEYDDEYEDEYEDDYYQEEEYEDEYEDDDYEDEDWDEEEDYDEPAPAPTTSFDFFAGCNSRESVDRKYKSLVKLYHPDNMDGDTAALQEINIQYTEAKKRFS